MIYGSVCSGVEAATLAWDPLGWEPAFFAEVEPFPSAVLMNRLGATKPIRPLEPEETEDKKEKQMRSAWKKAIAKFPETGTIPNFGDFTKIKKEDFHGKQIDLLVGGCPCQDFSVAGKRMGLDGHRGGLSLEFIRLAYELGTRWVLFENVPGLLSQDHGRAFGSFLSGLSGCVVTPPRDGWSTAGLVRNTRKDRFGLAWRVLDAQFTRVPGFPYAIPQRRRRLFVVGYFGDWRRAAEVLFERKMLRWDPPQSRSQRKETAGHADNCAQNADVFTVDAESSNSMKSGNPNSGFHKADVSKTLDTTVPTPQKSQGGQMVLTYQSGQENFVPKHKKQEGRFWNGEDVAETLTVTSDRQLMPDKGRLQCVVGSQDPICNTDHANAVNRNNGLENCVYSAFDAYNNTHTGNVSKTLNSAASDYHHVPVVYGIGNGQTDSANRMQKEVAQTLDCMHDAQAILLNEKKDHVIAYENHAQDSRVKELKDGVFPHINAKSGMGGGNLPLVQEIKCWDNQTRARNPEDTGDLCGTLQAAIGMGGNKLPFIQKVESVAIAENVIGRQDHNGPNGKGVQEELAYTQNATGVMGVSCNATVRRLIPIECERLMGFPDNWTRIPWNGKPEEECPDAPRYKACGNSMCVNVMRWIGMRIHKVEEMREER